MKKLKFLPGGQPFRSTDFELLQQQNMNGFSNLFASITEVAAILSGLQYPSLTGYASESPFTVQAGVIYDLVEICNVASAAFLYNAGKAIYLRRAQIETSERLVGGSAQYVIVEVVYNLVYTASPIAGDIRLDQMARLKVLTNMDNSLVQDVHLPVDLNSGFTATLGGGLYIFLSSANERMIVCQFTATTAAGTLAVLPAAMRPQFDLCGWYRAANTVMPLTIRANGNLEINGAVTSGTNIIMFRYGIGVTLTL